MHKANILKALTGLFLETAMEVGKEYGGDLEIEERIVDNTAMQLVINPSQFNIILTTNMFGDILSDEIAGLIGGLGLAPGGNIGKDVAIFEAVHGTAPDIAGKGIANPTALYLASAMMLEHINEKNMAKSLRNAIRKTLKNKQNEFNLINDKTLKNMWLDDLNELDKALNSHMLNILKVDEPIIKKEKELKRNKNK